MAFPFVPFPSSEQPDAYYTVLGSVTRQEIYRRNPILIGHNEDKYKQDVSHIYQYNCEITGIHGSVDSTKRYCMYLTTDSDGRQFLNITGNTSIGVDFNWVRTLNGQYYDGGSDTFGQLPLKYYNYSYSDEFDGFFTTNFPVFEDSTTANAYLTAQTDAQARNILTQALNYDDSEEPEGVDWSLWVEWATGTWTSYSSPAVQPSDVHIRAFRGKLVTGSVQLQKIDGVTTGLDTPGGKAVVSAIITSPDIEWSGLEMTEDGSTWNPISALPEWVYRKRDNEIGTFSFAITRTVDGPGGEPGDDPDNPTGDPDDDEDWGDTYSRSFFQQQYLMSEGAVNEIANALYDINPGGFWEDIKEGLDMFGNNPMDAVANLMYYPVDLSTVFTNVSTSADVWFGGYKFTFTSHNASKLIYKEGYFHCGGVTVEKTFTDPKYEWLNTQATRLYIDLPYCGRYELDPNRYYGKTINVIYYIDTNTGGCCACLVDASSGQTGKNGVCLDRFNGQIGTPLPITLTDFSAYANAQINTLLGGGGQAISQGGSQINQAVGSAAAGSAAGVLTAGAAAGVAGAIEGAKTIYGLQMNNINRFNQTKGGSSSMINQHLNQKPKFIFEYPVPEVPSGFYDLHGWPSNSVGFVGQFRGYLECDQVKLNIPGATENEKEKIRNLLLSGIFTGR